MAVWMVRAGAHAEHQAVALDNGVSVIDWRDLPDLSQIETKDELEALHRQVASDASD